MINNNWRTLGVGLLDSGHARNRENRRQQYRENRSAHMATISALVVIALSGLLSLTNALDGFVLGSVRLLPAVFQSQNKPLPVLTMKNTKTWRMTIQTRSRRHRS